MAKASQKKSVRRSKTSSKSKATRAKSSRTKAASQTKAKIKPISPERQLDIFGIIITVIGLLTLISLFTSNTGIITSWWVRTLGKIIGWGKYILPIGLITLGLWLLMRNFEKLPQVSIERLVGLFLCFINLLTWFHLIMAGTMDSASNGVGGGYIGAAIKLGLVQTLGYPGTVVALIAWMLTSLILILDLSVSDLSKWIGTLLKLIKRYLSTFVRKYRSKEQRKSASSQKTSPSGVYSQGQNNGPESKAGKIQTTAQLSQTTALPQGTSQAIGNGTPQKKHKWVLPDPRDILDPIQERPIDEENDQQRARVIEESLRSFGAPAHVVEIQRGPSITLFGVEPDFIESRNGRTRVRVSRITNLADDLTMALKASRIRIQAPVPGKGYVGIEVPNREIALVSLSEIISSSAFKNLGSTLKFALGKDVSGNAVAADLTAMPHLLIAGTTGSGKSVCINAILTCYLLFNSPDQLRLVLVDPKRVELTSYNGIPHLLAPVIVDADRVVGALQWLMREMDMRYHKFSDSGTRNIGEYNTWRISRNETTIPYLLVVIDELADLMMLAPDETERALTRLAQLARATGIHLILATQRPSTDILTGLIKANFPARIAFAVASGVDSRVILDQPGAERLLGGGDMLFQSPDAAAPVRLQGTFVSDNESSNLASFWRQQTVMPDSPTRPIQPAAFSIPQNVPYKQEPLWKKLQKDPDEDPITPEAIAIIRKERRASISMLQRKLRIGYTRAARMIEALESKGIIGPPNPQTKVREVLDYGSIGPPAEENQLDNYVKNDKPRMGNDGRLS